MLLGDPSRAFLLYDKICEWNADAARAIAAKLDGVASAPTPAASVGKAVIPLTLRLRAEGWDGNPSVSDVLRNENSVYTSPDYIKDRGSMFFIFKALEPIAITHVVLRNPASGYDGCVPFVQVFISNTLPDPSTLYATETLLDEGSFSRCDLASVTPVAFVNAMSNNRARACALASAFTIQSGVFVTVKLIKSTDIDSETKFRLKHLVFIGIRGDLTEGRSSDVLADIQGDTQAVAQFINDGHFTVLPDSLDLTCSGVYRPTVGSRDADTDDSPSYSSSGGGSSSSSGNTYVSYTSYGSGYRPYGYTGYGTGYGYGYGYSRPTYATHTTVHTGGFGAHTATHSSLGS